MTAIFDFNGSGMLGRKEMERGGDWEVNNIDTFPPPPPLPNRRLLLHIKHGRMSKKPRFLMLTRPNETPTLQGNRAMEF